MPKAQKNPWLELLAQVGQAAVKTLPVAQVAARDGRLLRDAAVNIGMATRFPFDAARTIYGEHAKGRRVWKTRIFFDALPEMIEDTEIRAWLQKWARGHGEMVRVSN